MSGNMQVHAESPGPDRWEPGSDFEGGSPPELRVPTPPLLASADTPRQAPAEAPSRGRGAPGPASGAVQGGPNPAGAGPGRAMGTEETAKAGDARNDRLGRLLTRSPLPCLFARVRTLSAFCCVACLCVQVVRGAGLAQYSARLRVPSVYRLQRCLC